MHRRGLMGLVAVMAATALGGYGVGVASSGDGARDQAQPVTSSTSATTSTTAATGSSAKTSESAAPPRCTPDASLSARGAAPADLAAAADAFVGHPGVSPHAVSLSVWVDGYGEVLIHQPDRALAPASNQKLYTAIGALAVLGAEARLTTRVRLASDGDLVIAPGGDPTLAGAGMHSVAALASQIHAAGVTDVPGRLLVDESRHDGTRRANGWQDWQIPAYTGPLSAFMVDRNRWRADSAFVADPALANAELLRDELAARGVTIGGPTAYAGTPASGQVVASLESARVQELVTTMLRNSDNQIADLLLREVGVAGGEAGSAVGAARATDAALTPLCLTLDGSVDDGSGLSRANARGAREWRVLLQAVRDEPWWPHLADALPVAARTGTLAGRFGGTSAADNVRAKTGTIIGGTALSGYGTTAGGRAFVFSVVVNGPGAEAAAGAVDGLVAAIAAHRD